MMRNLLMGLLLANVLLFVWGRWILAPDVADAMTSAEAAEPRLELVRRPSRLDNVSASGSARCFRLGPLSSAGAAATVAGQLSARGLSVSRASELGQIWVGHWVQLLDLPGVKAAGRVVDRLVSGGISDAYVFSREPTVDISLGVYRGREGADDVIRLARTLGYTAVATDRLREGIEYWVEIELPVAQPFNGPSSGLPDLADLHIDQGQSGQAQIIRIEERSCLPAAIIVSGSDSDVADDSLESRSGETGSPVPSVLPE